MSYELGYVGEKFLLNEDQKIMKMYELDKTELEITDEIFTMPLLVEPDVELTYYRIG